MILPPKMTHLSQMDLSHYLISPPKIFVISIWIRQFFTYSYVFVAKRHSFGLPSISSSFILAFASFTLLSFTYWQISLFNTRCSINALKSEMYLTWNLSLSRPDHPPLVTVAFSRKKLCRRTLLSNFWTNIVMLAKRRIANFRQNCEFAILNQDYGVVVYKPTPLGIFWLFCICFSQNILAIETPNMPVMLCWMLFHWNNAILLLLQIFFFLFILYSILAFLVMLLSLIQFNNVTKFYL